MTTVNTTILAIRPNNRPKLAKKDGFLCISISESKNAQVEKI